MKVKFLEDIEINKDDIIDLYNKLNWSSAKKPDELYGALLNSSTVISAWDQSRLIGLANALSDGYLVVYYPHLLVDPEYQGKGIGKAIMQKMFAKYGNFHQQVLVSKTHRIQFLCGFMMAMIIK